MGSIAGLLRTGASFTITFIIFCGFILQSCTLAKQGTPAQALIARSSVFEGLTKMEHISADFAALLNRFTDSDAGQLFIVEPPTLPQQPILLTQAQPMFGIYVEVTPGVFDVVTGLREVSIQYLNGIDVSFHNLNFDATTEQLLSYQISVNSNMRGKTTPAVLDTTLNLTITNFYPAQSSVLAPSSSTLAGEFIFMPTDGSSTDPKHFRINRFLGTATASGFDVTSGRQLYYRDMISNQFWSDTETVLYSSNSTPGTWIGRNIIKLYQDNEVLYSLTMNLLNGINVASTGTAWYLGVGQATFDNARVAVVNGGPYGCNITDPTAAGSGTPITLNWSDSKEDVLMPNDVNNCTRAIIIDTPAPAPTPTTP